MKGEKNMSKNPVFDKIKYFIIDMDGTFYLDGNIIDGAMDFLEKAKSVGKDFCFFTNNSSNNVEVCRTKLHNMGCDVTDDKIVISSHVTIEYLKRNYPGKTVYLLGNERLTADFENAGIKLVDDNPDIVVLGFDTTLNYEKIRKAALYLAAGKTYIATHPDYNCPTADGFMLDTGSMMAMFKASTGRSPLVMGKPHVTTVEYLTRKLNCEADELCFIGDRLETDIAIGYDNGLTSVLVLTGVTNLDMYARSKVKATFVANSLKSLSDEL
jgi:HAD superfamily hydrolase (TIGR01457 family)